MKLAVKKDTSGSNPLGGSHYMLHPMKMEHEQQAAIFEMMGYVIVEVNEKQGEALIAAAIAALNHQVSVAFLTEKALKDAEA